VDKLIMLKKELYLAELIDDAFNDIDERGAERSPDTDAKMREARDHAYAYAILLNRDVQRAEHEANEEAKREAMQSIKEGVTK